MTKKKNETTDNGELFERFKITNREVITVRPNTLHSKSAIPLSINAQRILFYSIYKIQHNQNTVSFTKQELSEAYGVDFGSFKEIKNYMATLRTFGTDVQNEKSDKMIFINAFSYLMYNNGVMEFKFNPDFLPIIGEQKRFLQLGMQSIEKFKSRFSAYFYQWLKDNMWGDRKLIQNIGLEEFKAIFKVEPDAYARQNSNFRRRVWQPAMDEINKYTDYEIRIETKGRGDSIRFDVIRLQNEDLSKQRRLIRKEKENKQNFECSLGLARISPECRNCMKINKCPNPVSEASWVYVPESDMDTMNGIRLFNHYTFWNNPHYDLETRIKNKVANETERRYFEDIQKRYKQIFDLVQKGNAVDDGTTLTDMIRKDMKDFEEFYFGYAEED